MERFHHVPVLLDEAVAGLNIRAGGIYVDGTLGGSGHAQAIFNKLQAQAARENNTARLIGIDRDTHALAAARARLPDITAVHGNFHNIASILRELGIEKIDGMLLDLGVSSHQLDTAERGFSYRFDGLLDMRMDNSQELTAAHIVNTAAEQELVRILFGYGEERHAKRITRAICAARKQKAITTTQELVRIIEQAAPHSSSHPAMRTFQALRIATNDELAPLEAALRSITAHLAPTGRIAVITFHSLEDRIVKHTFRSLANPCTCPRDIPHCVCGQAPTLRPITRRAVTAGAQELERNPRAHSAKLRISEKI